MRAPIRMARSGESAFTSGAESSGREGDWLPKGNPLANHSQAPAPSATASGTRNRLGSRVIQELGCRYDAHHEQVILRPVEYNGSEEPGFCTV